MRTEAEAEAALQTALAERIQKAKAARKAATVDNGPNPPDTNALDRDAAAEVERKRISRILWNIRVSLNNAEAEKIAGNLSRVESFLQDAESGLSSLAGTNREPDQDQQLTGLWNRRNQIRTSYEAAQSSAGATIPDTAPPDPDFARVEKALGDAEASLTILRTIIERPRADLRACASELEQIFTRLSAYTGQLKGRDQTDRWKSLKETAQVLDTLIQDKQAEARTGVGKSKGPEPAKPYAPPANLDEARQRYVQAQRELEKASGVKRWMTGDFAGKSKKNVEGELAKIELDYKKFRAEYVGASVDNFLAERIKYTETRLAEFAKRDKNPLETVARWNQKLGEINFVDKGGYKGPFKRIVKMANARTAISGALMAVGFLNARSAFGGVTAGFGMYGMVLSAREAYLAKRFKGNESLQNTEQLMYSLESRAALDGKNEELLNSDTYKKVFVRWEQLQRAEFASLAGRDAENYIQKQMAKTDVLLQEKLEDERKWKKLAVIAGTGTGILVGLGIPGKVIGQAKDLLSGHHEVVPISTGGGHDIALKPAPKLPVTRLPGYTETHLGQTPMGPHLAEAAPQPTGAGTLEHAKEVMAQKAVAAATHAKEAVTSGSLKHGASFEMQGTDEFINVGKHGIEGVILDQSDPNYAATLEWLKHLEYNQGITEKDPTKLAQILAHRYAEHLATEQHVTIDQLSHVLKGTKLIRHSDGSLGLGHVDYYTPHAVADVVQHPSAPSGISAGHETLSPADVHTETPDLSGPNIAEHAGAIAENPSDHIDSQSAVTDTTTALEHAHEVAAASVAKTSDGVRLILRENSDNFIKKFLHSSAQSLNKIKDMTYGDFINKFDSDSGFAKKYGNLVKQLNKARMVAGADSDLKMRRVIVELAKKFKSGTIR